MSQGLTFLLGITPALKVVVNLQNLYTTAFRASGKKKKGLKGWSQLKITFGWGEKKWGKYKGTNNISKTFFPRKAPVPWWNGLPAHHVPVFALPGGEQPLLPLTLSAGFSCVQLEWQFEPTRKFSLSPHCYTSPGPISHPTQSITLSLFVSSPRGLPPDSAGSLTFPWGCSFLQQMGECYFSSSSSSSPRRAFKITRNRGAPQDYPQ